MKTEFIRISDAMLASYPEVTTGNMMRSDALKVNGKVFCFFHEEEMCFKLGKGTDLDRPELVGARYLSPFKNKPPMKAWIILPFVEHRIWQLLAEEALLVVRDGKG